MNDINIAINNLNTQELTLSVVKGSEIIYNSTKRGVLPIYEVATNPKYATDGASVADKVTGRGAALLCAYAKIKCLHTGMISKSAAEVLESFEIEFTYSKMVDFIKNRSGDGGCPVEALTKDISKPEEAIDPIKGFLNNIGVL